MKYVSQYQPQYGWNDEVARSKDKDGFICEWETGRGAALSRAPAEKPKVPRPALSLDLGGGVKMDLVLIPAGEFMMGSRDSAQEIARKTGHSNVKAGQFASEYPLHRVQITKPFYMGMYEVTQAQYERVMGTNPSVFKGPRNPVQCITWNYAREFCRKLSQKTGKGVRLPTEAEWEYACRAGTTTPFHYGNSLVSNQANFNGNYPYDGAAKGWQLGMTSVGSFAANAWGLYDMHGNVWEWCADWYDNGYYAKSPEKDPTGPAKGRLRVLRGGCTGSLAGMCRSAFRLGFLPESRRGDMGFRVVVAAGLLADPK